MMRDRLMMNILITCAVIYGCVEKDQDTETTDEPVVRMEEGGSSSMGGASGQGGTGDSPGGSAAMTEEENTDALCADMVDNDGKGFTDCEDYA